MSELILIIGELILQMLAILVGVIIGSAIGFIVTK